MNRPTCVWPVAQSANLNQFLSAISENSEVRRPNVSDWHFVLRTTDLSNTFVNSEQQQGVNVICRARSIRRYPIIAHRPFLGTAENRHVWQF